MTDTTPVKYAPHFCGCSPIQDKVASLERIATQARELVTMPINFSELRLQLLHLLDEHDKIVEREK